MKHCTECNREYPDHLVQELAIGGGGKLRYIPLCPICAYGKYMNPHRGLPPDTPPTSGTIARRLWLEAKRYMEKKKL